jgi:hypothetical protein
MTQPLAILITKADWLELKPWEQGYVLYMQAAHPGSELKDLDNPYPHNSEEWVKFEEGQQCALNDVVDGEE